MISFFINSEIAEQLAGAVKDLLSEKNLLATKP